MESGIPGPNNQKTLVHCREKFWYYDHILHVAFLQRFGFARF